MHNRKSSYCSGKTKPSTLASCMSMQSIYSASPYQNSYREPSPDQVILDLQNDLKTKDHTISLLQKRIEDLLVQNKHTSRPEHLHKLLKKGDAKLENLKEQIEKLALDNEKLLLKQKDLLGIISSYRKENAELKKIRNCEHEHGFEELRLKLGEIEILHEGLRSENSGLKLELSKAIQKNDENVDLKFSVLSAEISKIKLELGGLLRLLKIVRTGKEFDLNLLLRTKVQDEKLVKSSYEKCSELVFSIRKDIDEVKNIISDMQAENSGSQCSTQ